jgi:tetratricopeptide (TPR) repeat protein
MRVEYSAPLNLYTWTGDENVLMLDESVGKVPLVPYEATSGADGLIALAKSYAELKLYVQALMCLKKAVERNPDRTDIDAMYSEYQQALSEQIAKSKQD